jgi:hypothetical protein
MMRRPFNKSIWNTAFFLIREIIKLYRVLTTESKVLGLTVVSRTNLSYLKTEFALWRKGIKRLPERVIRWVVTDIPVQALKFGFRPRVRRTKISHETVPPIRGTARQQGWVLTESDGLRAHQFPEVPQQRHRKEMVGRVRSPIKVQRTSHDP